MFPSTLEVLEKTNESIFCFGNTVGLISVVSIVILLNVYIHQLLQVSLLIAEIFMAGSSIRMRRVRSSHALISKRWYAVVEWANRAVILQPVLNEGGRVIHRVVIGPVSSSIRRSRLPRLAMHLGCIGRVVVI